MFIFRDYRAGFGGQICAIKRLPIICPKSKTGAWEHMTWKLSTKLLKAPVVSKPSHVWPRLPRPKQIVFATVSLPLELRGGQNPGIRGLSGFLCTSLENIKEGLQTHFYGAGPASGEYRVAPGVWEGYGALMSSLLRWKATWTFPL